MVKQNLNIQKFVTDILYTSNTEEMCNADFTLTIKLYIFRESYLY